MASNSNYANNVAIIGAGGQIGKVFLEALLKTGKHTVTVITRPESESLFPPSVNVVRVNYNAPDDSSLVDALRGHQVLIITLAVTAPRDLLGKLIQAGDKAGVPYILPNYWGFDPKNDALTKDVFFDAVRDGIYANFEKCKISQYILLACGMWFEFSLAGGPDRYGFDFEMRTFIQYDNWDVPMTVTTWPQCGRAIANLLSLPLKSGDDAVPSLSQFGNGVVYISSFRTTQREMLDSVLRLTKTKREDWAITHESVEQRYKEAKEKVSQGDFSAYQKMLYARQFFATADADQSKHVSANDVLGLPQEDFDEAVAVALQMQVKDSHH